MLALPLFVRHCNSKFPDLAHAESDDVPNLELAALVWDSLFKPPANTFHSNGGTVDKASDVVEHVKDPQSSMPDSDKEFVQTMERLRAIRVNEPVTGIEDKLIYFCTRQQKGKEAGSRKSVQDDGDTRRRV